MEALTQDVVNYPDAFYRERAKRLGVSRSAVGRGVKRLKVIYIANPL
jgi:hypothetical protein